MPHISVIVPVYNVSKYLSKCLDSLVSQTMKSLEILVVNDGSTDLSGDIAEEYMRRFPEKIRVFHKKNGGLSDARNFGIEQAKGEYLAFVDSDDFVDEEMMEKMYSLSQYYQAQIVICNLQKIDEQGRVTQRLSQLPNFPLVFSLKDRGDAFSDMSYFACNKIFHRSLFEENRFTKGIHFEDIELIPRLLLRAQTIARTDVYYYQYFERSDSISKTHTIKGLDMLSAVDRVAQDYRALQFPLGEQPLKKFVILQGYFSFLAYLAYVQDEEEHKVMRASLSRFMEKYKISKRDILMYRRFGQNYILSLPLRKKIYYLLYLGGFHGVIRRMMRK